MEQPRRHRPVYHRWEVVFMTATAHARRALVACVLCASPALAQDAAPPGNTAGRPVATPKVFVTSSPLGNSGLFDMAQPASVVAGPELTFRREPTLGETLGQMPGVSSSYFGPNASRPVIRGLDGDRIRLLNNGTGIADASSLSFDHAVPADPLVADRVEVVRGPAALMYGGSAVGGVVNVIDNRIPAEAIDGVTGRGEVRYGGAADERSGVAVLEAGHGGLVLHADAFQRRTGDLRIPGYARSARLRAQDPQAEEPRDRLPNSSAESSGGSVGASLVGDRGYVGLSYGGLNSNYGTVVEEDVRIDMQSERVDARGELRDIEGFVTGLKFNANYTDYQHRELEGSAVGTTFLNKAYEGRIEALHRPVGRMQGAFGLQFLSSDFSALGDEAFVPDTTTRSAAVFAFEELPFERSKVTFGARLENPRVSSEGGGATDPVLGGPRFGDATSRSFTALSGSVGAIHALTGVFSVAANAAHTERAPTQYELFANGPHLATNQYEIGNRDFGRERSNALDVQLRAQAGPHSGYVGAFYTRFDNFIGLFGTGNTRGKDGELNPQDLDGDGIADLSGEPILTEAAFRQVRAEFRGFEAEGRFRLVDRSGTLHLTLRGDYTRATNRADGRPLPRIPPLRFGAGLDYVFNNLGARLDVQYAAAQDRVSEFELATDSYTLVNAMVNYRFQAAHMTWDAYARLMNLLDEEARNAASFLKDIAPLPGRGLMVGVRASF
jgi:iron complex outermembrane receptor protein